MYSDLELPWSKAQESADAVIFKKTGKHLSDIEIKVLQASWERQTYDEMAKNYGYSAEYLNKDVGNKLWHKLSETLGETVTKKNFKQAIMRAIAANINTAFVSRSLTDIPFPEGSVPLDSPFYIERPGVDCLCDDTMAKPGSLLRIKAPKLMGKTSLMMRIKQRAIRHNYQAVYLDLGSVERDILSNLDRFLRWLCVMVGRQLKLENKLNDYWDTDILGSNDNCTVYFEEYLLAEINCPLVLGLDEVDRVFPHSAVIEDFLGMLRSWHEKGKISEIWQQLRIAIAHSTEVYIPLDINQSPFNAGVSIELQEFNLEQVQTLANLHQLNWHNNQVEQLMTIVGGHPYLVRLAMYEISCKKITLDGLLKNAATEAGIYSNHLRRHLEILQQIPELAQAYKKVITSPEPVELNPMQIYKLHSMGLVKRQDNHVIPRCNLYREYFQRVLV
jgi:AAA-like domain